MSRAYNDKFMSYADESSRLAAARITTLLAAELRIQSVLDIGCAKGTWLQAWLERGISDIQGVDGDYVNRDKLVIAQDRFRASDLSKPLDLGRKFDLVQSLEVAEHIQASAADTFVSNLTRHSHGIVLFSAAPPGQGGEFHVNEQPYDYWREKFSAHGFQAHDWLRPRIANDPAISFWYRYNTFLYVHNDVISALPKDLHATRTDPARPLADISPALFKIRKRLVTALPAALRDGLARFKANFFPSGRW